MEYEKKNKDAISTIKQALRQLSTNGVPVGNMIKAIKDIEEKYAESDDERIRGNIIATIHLYYGEPLEDEAKEMIAWLEKQCEQKIKTPEESLGIDSDTYNKIVDECIYGEQKPTDNVEPKFHEGEWIIHQGTENIYQVVARIDNQYQLKYGDNYTIQKCADVDRCARLWDITKDAKNGDALATSSGPFIYNGKYDGSSCPGCYCGINTLGRFERCICETNWTSKKVYPATKEQRDALMKAMNYVGYKWNAETKTFKRLDKPKFDLKTLQPFDKVLVKVDSYWRIELFSNMYEYMSDIYYACARGSYKECIPYNDETKHLLGTSDEAPEYYRYWED